MLTPSHSTIFHRRFPKEKSLSPSSSVVPSNEKNLLKPSFSQFPCALSPKCHTKASPSFNPEQILLHGSSNYHDFSPEPESTKFEEALQFLLLRDIGCSRKQAIEYTSRNVKNKEILLSRLPKDLRYQFKQNLEKTRSKPYNFMSDDKNFESVSNALYEIIEQKEAKIDVNAQKFPIRRNEKFLTRKNSETKVFNNDTPVFSPRVIGKHSPRVMCSHISQKAMLSNYTEHTDSNYLPEISPKSNRLRNIVYGNTFHDEIFIEKPDFINGAPLKNFFQSKDELSEENQILQKDDKKLAVKIKTEKMIKNRTKRKRDEKNTIFIKDLQKKPVEHSRKQSQDVRPKASMGKRQLHNVFEVGF